MMGLSDSKKFSDRFSRFDTIPECDRHPTSQPATQPPSHVAVAITLNALAKASSLKTDRNLICVSRTYIQKEAMTSLIQRIMNINFCMAFYIPNSDSKYSANYRIGMQLIIRPENSHTNRVIVVISQ